MNAGLTTIALDPCVQASLGFVLERGPRCRVSEGGVFVAGVDSIWPRRRWAGGSAILNPAGVAALVASMALAACGGTGTPSTGGTVKTGASSGDPIGTVPTPESST